MLVLLLLATSTAASGEFKPEWRACSKDADCAVVQGTCGEWACVNAAHRDEAEAFYREAAAEVRCTPPSARPKPKFRCVKKECACR
ncbi:MAG TPA: hypothetical protein VM598_04025 [Bdellovibrionota bacterium]|nr:hypothetical protein [Bdellovibrionota bacterium]